MSKNLTVQFTCDSLYISVHAIQEHIIILEVNNEHRITTSLSGL